MSPKYGETDDKIIVFWGTSDIRSDGMIKEIGDAIQDLCLNAETSNKELFIDLRDTPFVSSTVLGVFVQLNRFAKKREVPFRLVNLGPQVVEVLKVTRLDTVLRTDNDDYDGGPDLLGAPVPLLTPPATDAGQAGPQY